MLHSTPIKLTFLLLGFAILSCGCNDYGQSIVVDGTQVFFDGEKTTKADAEKLGKALQDLGFTDGNEKAVKLVREDDKLIFKMVVQSEFLNSTEMDHDFQIMCLQLSDVFDGQTVDCHACDQQLVTKKSFSGLSGKRTEFGKSEIYLSEVTNEHLANVKVVLKDSGFMESSATLYFGKVAEAFEFRMVSSKEFLDDEGMPNETKRLQDELSKAVGGEKVTVMLCNLGLQPIYTVKAE